HKLFTLLPSHCFLAVVFLSTRSPFFITLSLAVNQLTLIPVQASFVVPPLSTRYSGDQPDIFLAVISSGLLRKREAKHPHSVGAQIAFISQSSRWSRCCTATSRLTKRCGCSCA